MNNFVVKYCYLLCLITFVCSPLQGGKNKDVWKEPVNLSILNTTDDDFAPSWNIYENCLYYNTLIEGYSKFYVADSLADEYPKPAAGALNQKGDNRSYICFDAEGRAYLTAFRMFPGRPYQNIFEARKDMNGWTTPFPIDSLKSESFNAHPAVSPDGSVMAFASNRMPGRADTDLWIAYRMENGTWGNARPLNNLNTNGNEITPFFASDDTLYFASDGLGGPGGYDIFMSVNIMGAWQNPYPVNSLNTRFNESDFVILPNGTAVFASDKPGGKGKLDLYSTSLEESKTVIQQKQSELEIEIAAQVSSIRSFLDLKYNYYPVFSFILDDGTPISSFAGHVAQIEEQVPVNPDSVYIYSPSIIGKRLQKNTGAGIILNLVTSGKSPEKVEKIKHLADSLVIFFAVNFGIAKSRIEYKEAANNIGVGYKNTEPVIFIESDYPQIMKPLELGELNIRIEPPVIQASVLARPEKDFRDFECELFINSDKTGFWHKSSDLSEEVFINLNDYSSSIIRSDSIVLKVTARDRYSNISRQNMVLDNLYSESKTQKVRKEKKTKYFDYYYLLVEEPDSGPALSQMAENLTDLCVNAVSMKVYFFVDNNMTAEKAAAVADALNAKLGGLSRFSAEYSSVPDSFASRLNFRPLIAKISIAVE